MRFAYSLSVNGRAVTFRCMDPVFSTTLAGLQDAVRKLNDSAFRVVRTQGAGPDLAANFVAMTTARVKYQSELAVMNASDKMFGNLLDILA